MVLERIPVSINWPGGSAERYGGDRCGHPGLSSAIVRPRAPINRYEMQH